MTIFDFSDLVTVTPGKHTVKFYHQFVMLKEWLDALYDTYSDIVDLLNLMTIDRLFITLPTPPHLTILLAEKVNGAWSKNDFRLSIAPTIKKKLVLPGVTFHLPGLDFDVDWAMLIRIWLNIQNLGFNDKEVTTTDHHWYVNGDLIRASQYGDGSKYTIGQLASDVAIIGVIGYIIHYLGNMGLGTWVSKAAAKVTFKDVIELSKTAYNTQKAADNTDQMIEDLSSIQDTADVISDVASDTQESVVAVASNVSSVLNNLTSIGATLTGLDTTSRTLLLKLLSAIGLRMKL